MPRVEIRAEGEVWDGGGGGGGGGKGSGWKGPQPYIGGLSYRTFTLQSCVVIYGCRSLIRRIRTPLSPHVCCPSIDPIYRDETGVRKVLPGQTSSRKFVSLGTYRFSIFARTDRDRDRRSVLRSVLYPIVTFNY